MPKLSRALVLCALSGVFGTFGVASTARADDVPITEEARSHFAAGVALLQDPTAPRYEEAYREFKAAYAASPSYKILGNLGLCAMKLEKDDEAIFAYERYLREAGKDLPATEREQLQRDVLTLKAGVARVTITSDPPGVVVTDVRVPSSGDPIRNVYTTGKEPLHVGIRRGHHVMTARAPGLIDASWEFDAASGEVPSHHFRLEPPRRETATKQVVRERPIPTVAIVTGSVGVVFAATALTTGLLALSAKSDFNRLNDGAHVGEARDARDRGQTFNTLTDVSLAVSAVSFGLTAYLVLSRPTVEHTVGRVRLIPSVGPAGASLFGQF
jgi:hypothetical protein